MFNQVYSSDYTTSFTFSYKLDVIYTDFSEAFTEWIDFINHIPTETGKTIRYI